MMAQELSQWFVFRAHSSEALYGYGTAEEADRYADIISHGKEVDLYSAHPLSEEESAELHLNDRDDAFDLEGELRGRQEETEE